MPNYSDTIIKIFVPNSQASKINAVIAALARPGLKVAELLAGQADARWIDFERLLPIPDRLLVLEDEHRANARNVLLGRWPMDLEIPADREVPVTTEQIETLYRELEPAGAATLDAMRSSMECLGVPTAYEWQSMKWGTKWQPDDCGSPRIEETDTENYQDMVDTVMVHYRITTAWSAPLGYLGALMRACTLNRFGLRCWTTYDDNTVWNPDIEERQTVWSPLEDFDLDPGTMTSSDRLMFEANGPWFGPDAEASTKISTDDPLQKMLRMMQ